MAVARIAYQEGLVAVVYVGWKVASAEAHFAHRSSSLKSFASEVRIVGPDRQEKATRRPDEENRLQVPHRRAGTLTGHSRDLPSCATFPPDQVGRRAYRNAAEAGMRLETGEALWDAHAR